MPKGADTAAISLLPATAAGLLNWGPLPSLAAGLAGVILARLVYIQRENRRMKRKQRFRESLPLTLVAVLITSVWITDHDLAIGPSAYIGLGVGWGGLLTLDIIGDRVNAALRALLGLPGPPPPITHAEAISVPTIPASPDPELDDLVLQIGAPPAPPAPDRLADDATG